MYRTLNDILVGYKARSFFALIPQANSKIYHAFLINTTERCDKLRMVGIFGYLAKQLYG